MEGLYEGGSREMTLTSINKNDILLISAEDTDFLLSKQPLSMCEETPVSSAEHRTGAFLLEGIMKTKVCYKCKEVKSILEFRQYKSGVNKGYYHSYCKECKRKYDTTPWVKTRQRIMSRCYYEKNSSYYKRGIKNFLTARDTKYLWFRDKAYEMVKPSIDRRNPKKDYTLENCRYLELLENKKRKE